MTETEFNAKFRRALRAQGVRASHIRETDTPGALDVLVYRGSWLAAWVELKIDNNSLEPSQVQFIEDNPDCCCRVVRLINRKGQYTIEYYDDPLKDCLKNPKYKWYGGKKESDVATALLGIRWIKVLVEG